MSPKARPGTISAAAVLLVPASLALLLTVFTLIPRAQSNPTLRISIASAAGVLLVYTGILWRRVVTHRRVLEVQFLPRPVHYVQLAMHLSVYTYWGWYWREVYGYVPLILAQILFAYALDILVSYSKRDKWIAGFGPIPIILSTNLFLWFRDDWFFLQFVMIALGVLGKEFIHWQRDGRRTHIFNPSAVGLFTFSIILLATGTTSITWGLQIAETLHRPPNIYLEIFVLGLIVQALFAVTLVTLSAAASLLILNLIYTRVTGVYQFVDSNIPVSVFLGLHLLVTDPATSPRSRSGKAIFGGLYGLCVFALYSLLATMGAPRFYDKLLCVPPLNLCVRWLDRLGDRLDAWFASMLQRLRAPHVLWAGTPRQANWVFMSVWVTIFAWMFFSGFVTTELAGTTHPGAAPGFWARACSLHEHNACVTWTGVLNAQCERGSGGACLQMASLTDSGLAVPRDPEAAGRGYGRACDLGDPAACQSFLSFVARGGSTALDHACRSGDPYSCFYLATVLNAGRAIPRDPPRALALFQSACTYGYDRGCGAAGQMYLAGQGTVPSASLALTNFERACTSGWGQSCADAANLYRNGSTGSFDSTRANQLLARACELSYDPACSTLYTH